MPAIRVQRSVDLFCFAFQSFFLTTSNRLGIVTYHVAMLKNARAPGDHKTYICYPQTHVLYFYIKSYFVRHVPCRVHNVQGGGEGTKGKNSQIQYFCSQLLVTIFALCQYELRELSNGCQYFIK